MDQPTKLNMAWNAEILLSFARNDTIHRRLDMRTAEEDGKYFHVLGSTSSHIVGSTIEKWYLYSLI